jgi:phage tail sheath protein FI
LSSVKINPIATLPGVGLVNMGQYSRTNVPSSLDRINVARLVGYLRRQLTILSKPFLFEPNDSQTRKEIKTSIEGLLLELVGQRAIYDYVVVCDSTNNTPSRIDQSELYVDIAIEPVKAVEFIYIPLRLLNTGAISSGNYGSQAK